MFSLRWFRRVATVSKYVSVCFIWLVHLFFKRAKSRHSLNVASMFKFSRFHWISAGSAKSLPLAVGKAINNRVAKLALYKECVALANIADVGKAKRVQLEEVRRSWRCSMGDGGVSLQVTVASALDRICYARMCLCKQRCKLVPQASVTYEWLVKNPLRITKSL